MENTYSGNDPFAEESQLNMDVELTPLAKDYIMESAKWAKFISIVGFVFIGLFVIFAFFAGTLFSSLPVGEVAGVYESMGGLLTAMYLFIAAIYFFPTFFLFRFASKTIVAIQNYDSGLLTEGLGNLKSSFKSMGIILLIVLGLYAMGFVFGILGAVFF